jgi:hypothetical protein
VSLIFKPNGSLDVATAATDLPEQGAGATVISEALARAVNISNDRTGFVTTRSGSTTVGSPVNERLTFMTVQAGVRYEFSSTRIYKDEVAIAIDLSTGNEQWSALQYNQFNDTDHQIFALNGAERKRINGADVFEWGIAAPDTKPTVVAGASTGLTGDYKAKYTYLRVVGTTVVSESNPSEASDAVTLSNNTLKTTWTASSDPQVTHVRVYRTLADDGNFYIDTDVAIGTTELDSSTADADLGTIPPSDHDRPPAAGDICIGPVYDGYCFIADGNLLYWCLPKRVEYWPQTYFIEVSPPQEPIRAMAIHDGQLYVATDRKIYWIQGSLSNTFAATPVSTQGTPNLHCLVGVRGTGLFHVAPDGLYLLAGGLDRKITEKIFEPLFRNEATAGLAAVPLNSSRWLFSYENRVYFHYGNGTTLVLNVDQTKWTSYKFDQKLVAPAYDQTNSRFLTGTGDDQVRQIEDRTATDDAGSTINWQCQSKDFTLQTRRHFPRWIKYDAESESDATGTMILDDGTHQEHTLSTNRMTKRRLVTTGNGRRVSIRVNGTGAATIYAIETE